MKRGGGQGNTKSSKSSSSKSSMSPQGEIKKSPPINILHKKRVIYNKKQENLLQKGRMEDIKMMVEKDKLETEAKRIEESAKKIQALQRGRKTRKRTGYLKRILAEEPQDQGYNSDREEYTTEAGKQERLMKEEREQKRRFSLGGTRKKRRRRKTRKGGADDCGSRR